MLSFGLLPLVYISFRLLIFRLLPIHLLPISTTVLFSQSKLNKFEPFFHCFTIVTDNLYDFSRI